MRKDPHIDGDTQVNEPKFGSVNSVDLNEPKSEGGVRALTT